MLLQLVILLLILKITFWLILSVLKYFSGKSQLVPATATNFSVDIIVPMYNEEKVIVNTIANLLKVDHDCFNVIVVDDGSTDNGLSTIKNVYQHNPRVSIISQQNSGKAHALNRAIRHSTSDIIICIDADTMVRPDIIKQMLPYFADSRVAAVSGYVNVGNRNNIITATQYVEYITRQNYERIMFEAVNGIWVIPGAIGAFRRSVVNEVGGYCTGLLTEDNDITMKILCHDYLIKNAPGAVAYTEAPADMNMFFKQRSRWNTGLAQILVLYSKRMFQHTNKALFFLMLPYVWLYGLILPLLLPLLDYFMVFLYIRQPGDFITWFPWYLSYVAIDIISCIWILIRSKEKPWLMLFTVFQRFFLRHLSLFVYFNMLLRFFKGNLTNWDKIVRYGSVKVE
jgi:cellulose synthase/poly-beta-1,6-N-acetylglucosamine synthase-like glycosyltransferase